MKILITGGCGFIGQHTNRLLSCNSYDVACLDSLAPQVHGDLSMLNISSFGYDGKLIVGDVRCREHWLEAINGVESIIHFAAQTGTGQSMYQVSRYSDENIGGTALMWDILANNKHKVKKVIVASSRSIYGEGAYMCTGQCGFVVPMPRTNLQMSQGQWETTCPNCGSTARPIATPEESIPQPASFYACTKLAQEQMSITMGKALGISTAALRFQNVFGPGQSLRNPYTGIISIFSNQMRQSLPINIFEDGEETRDFVFVEDVAKICQFMLSIDFEAITINVGSGTPTKVVDLAYSLKQLWDSNSSIEITGDYRVGDIRHNWADLQKLNMVFPNWKPTSLSDGLKKFVSWAKTQDIYEDKSQTAAQELKQSNL